MLTGTWQFGLVVVKRQLTGRHGYIVTSVGGCGRVSGERYFEGTCRQVPQVTLKTFLIWCSVCTDVRWDIIARIIMERLVVVDEYL